MFTKKHLSHVFTHKIVEHLQQETGLSCVAVSTPADVKLCGEFYSKILKSLEETVIQNNYNFSPFAKMEGVVIDTHSKNKQLLQIIEHAVANYPDAQHVFDFVDDRLDLCKAALTLSDRLPKNIVLNVFQHDAFDSTPLEKINPQVTKKNNYCSFFTKVALKIVTSVSGVVSKIERPPRP